MTGDRIHIDSPTDSTTRLGRYVAEQLPDCRGARLYVDLVFPDRDGKPPASDSSDRIRRAFVVELPRLVDALRWARVGYESRTKLRPMTMVRCFNDPAVHRGPWVTIDGRCGHSACSQHFIDTGSPACIAEAQPRSAS